MKGGDIDIKMEPSLASVPGLKAVVAAAIDHPRHMIGVLLGSPDPPPICLSADAEFLPRIARHLAVAVIDLTGSRRQGCGCTPVRGVVERVEYLSATSFS